MNAGLRILAPMTVFGLGSVPLSYCHYAVHRGWATGSLSSSSQWPYVLAIVLCGFSLFITIWHLGWAFLATAIIGGLAFSFCFMSVFRMWPQLAPVLGSISALAAMIVMRHGWALRNV
jgi:hypothetical protein